MRQKVSTFPLRPPVSLKNAVAEYSQHAVDLALELGIPRVIVPVRPGITNGPGCMVADLRHD